MPKENYRIYVAADIAVDNKYLKYTADEWTPTLAVMRSADTLSLWNDFSAAAKPHLENGEITEIVPPTSGPCASIRLYALPEAMEAIKKALPRISYIEMQHL